MTAPLSIETLDKLRRRITLNLDPSGIASEVQKKLTQRAKTARAAGFRPGKVPMKMVASMYGPEIESEAIHSQLVKQYSAFVQGNQVKIAGYPEFAAVDNTPPGSLSYYASFEVFPSIDLSSLDQLKLEKIEVSISDADINQTIDNIRKQNAHFHPKGQDHEHGDGGAAIVAKGDQVVIDFVGTENGEAFQGGTAQDFAFVVGEGRMLPAFEEAVLGLAIGAEKSFDLTFPDDYPAPMTSKTVQFKITVKEINWMHLPEFNSDLAVQLGIIDGDVERLKKDIRRNLEQEILERMTQKNKQAVIDALLTHCTFDAPTQMITNEANRLQEEMSRDAQRQNSQIRLPKLDNALFTQAAERRVRSGLIISELVEQHKLQATQEEIRAEVERIALRYDDKEKVIEWYTSNKDRLSDVEAVVIENKAVAFVFAQAKTTTVQQTMSDLK